MFATIWSRGGNPSCEQFSQNTNLNSSSVRGCAAGQDDVTEEGILEFITASLLLCGAVGPPQPAPALPRAGLWLVFSGRLVAQQEMAEGQQPQCPGSKLEVFAACWAVSAAWHCLCSWART